MYIFFIVFLIILYVGYIFGDDPVLVKIGWAIPILLVSCALLKMRRQDKKIKMEETMEEDLRRAMEKVK